MDLAAYRRKRDMTQDAVATAAGIARVTYTNIENGRRRPSPDVAKRIAAALGFDWTEFFSDDREDNAHENDARP